MVNLKKIYGMLSFMLSINLMHAAVDGIMDRNFALGQASEELPICKAAVASPDRKILVAGYVESHGKKTFAVARLLDNGMLDRSFGKNGIAVTPFTNGETASSAQVIMIDSCGKIVAAGFTNGIANKCHACLARYNADGSLDKSFFGGRGIFKGTVITTFGSIDEMSHINGLIETKDQKIVAVGGSYENGAARFALARYNQDGSLDVSFNPKGQGSARGMVCTQFESSSNDEAFAVALDVQENIVVAGSSYASGIKTFALARYRQDGSLDTSFADNSRCMPGTVVTNFMCGETEGVARAVRVQEDGKILVGGHTNAFCGDNKCSHFALARYMPNGMVDTNFGADHGAMPGTVVTNFGNEKVRSAINALLIQTDNKIVAGGYAEFNKKKHFALARYDKDGACDYTFNGGGASGGKVLSRSSSTSSDEIFGLALAMPGDIIAVGKTQNDALCYGAVARYMCDQDVLCPEILLPVDNQVIVEGTKVKIKGLAHHSGRMHLYLDDKYLDTLSVKQDTRWDYHLPALSDGSHCVQICECYDAGNMMMSSRKIHITVDQHPVAINQSMECQGMRSMQGSLAARGASGNYTFKIMKENNCKVNLTDDGSFTVAATIPYGQASFEFQVKDDLTQCVSMGHVNLEVREVPLAGSVALHTAQNKELHGSLEYFVMGGQKPYLFELMNGCTHGNCMINPEGSFTFTPEVDYIGNSEFSFMATDMYKVTSEPGRIEVQVHPIPRAKECTLFECANTLIHGKVNSYAFDGRKPYTFAIGHVQDHCSVTMEEDGSFICIPESDYFGQVSFEYLIVDARGYESKPCMVHINLYENLKEPLCLYPGNMQGDLSKMCGEANCDYELYYAPEGLQIELHKNGEFTVAAAESRTPIEFMYKVTNEVGMSKLKKVRVLSLNEPIAQSIMQEVQENHRIEGNLNELVTEGLAPFQYKILSAKNGKINCKADGSYEFMPRFDKNDKAEFSYIVTDANNHMSNVAKVAFKKIIRSINN